MFWSRVWFIIWRKELGTNQQQRKRSLLAQNPNRRKLTLFFGRGKFFDMNATLQLTSFPLFQLAMM